MLKQSKEYKNFSQVLLAWFKINARMLPWRKTYSPYHVLVSEFMLQQTQMERVVSYFNRFIKNIPSVKALALAPPDKVLKLWEGLGYYSRVRNLHKTAQILYTAYSGQIPKEKQILQSLPGIGPYTAAAILSIAYEKDEPLVDANVIRVLCRVFDIGSPVAEIQTRNQISELASMLLPQGKARNFNQALMELGALVCTPKSPVCADCPVHTLCEAKRLGIVIQRPVPGKKKNIQPLAMATGILQYKGKYFIQRREDDDTWGGLWEFPGGCLESGETPEQAVVREYAEETGYKVQVKEKITSIIHTYTHHRVTLHCFYVTMPDPLPAPQLTAASQWQLATFDELTQLAFPAGHRKLLDFLEKQKDKASA